MDACEAVEKELLRVISKFNAVHEHSKRVLGDVTKNFDDLRSSIAEGKTLSTFIFNFYIIYYCGVWMFCCVTFLNDERSDGWGRL